MKESHVVLYSVLILILILVGTGRNSQKDKVELDNRQINRLTRYDMLFKDILPKWDIEKPLFYKEVDITVYTSQKEETDDTPYITANMSKVKPGGMAVSRDLLEVLGGYGKRVVVKGYGIFVINDTMNKRFTNSIDIWGGDLKAALNHGRQKGTIIWQ